MRSLRFTALTCGLALLCGVGAAVPATAETAATEQPAATWSPVFTLTSGQDWVDGVAAPTAGEVWSAGSRRGPDFYSRPYLFHTVDGATTELPFPADFTTRWGRFTGVDATATSDVWAVGVFVGKTNGISTPLLARWNGTSFVPTPLPLPANADGELTAVSVRSRNDVWIAGNVGDFDETTLFHWNGTSITQVPVPVADPLCSVTTARSVDITTTGNAVWLALRCQLKTDARYASSVQYYRNGTWTLAYSTGPSGGLVSIADNGSGTVLATGFKPVFGGSSVPILVGGRSTLSEVATFAAGDFYWDVAARGNAVYLVGQVNINNTARVLRRSSGTSFVMETVNGQTPLFGAAIDPAGTAYAVGPAFGGAFSGYQVGLYQRIA